MDERLKEIFQAAKAIGETFLNQFFQSNDPNELIKYYGSDSFFTFESEQYVGPEAIIGKLSQLKLNLKINNWDIQPSACGILIYLSGMCALEGESNAFPFVRIIFLASANNSYYGNILLYLNIS